MSSAFPHLQGQQYISLTTFRKSGQGVPTPVWFAQVGDKLYIYTSANSGKIKRIRHTTRVTVAPCTARGEVLGAVQDAQARILSPQEEQTANNALNAKYGLIKRVFEAVNALGRLFQRRSDSAAYIEIRPA